MPTAPPLDETNASDSPGPTVACQVCRDDVAVESTVALRACDHRFCVACISSFLSVQIREATVQLTCFYMTSPEESGQRCNAPIDKQDIQQLVSSEVLATYTRFMLFQSNDRARACPHCDHAQVVSMNETQPACICERCARPFCFTHGNAHNDSESCAQFEKRQARAEARSGRLVKKISRPCPQCARPIEKNGGCSHMTCRVCKAQFCWSCGAAWGFVYSAHHQPLHIDCCDGIAELKVPFLDSESSCVRGFMKGVYFTLTTAIGMPLTIATCWVWIPYTVCAENRAVVKRARVLARGIGIYATLLVVVSTGVVVVITFQGLDWVGQMISNGWKKLRQLIGNCWRRCTRSHTPDRLVIHYDFKAMPDTAPAV